MVIYLTSIVFVILGSLFAQFIRDRAVVYPKIAKNILLFIVMFFVFLAMFLPAAFRNHVGTDYSSYILMYEHPEWYSSTTNGLFINFVKILRSVSNNYQSFFIVTSVLIYGVIVIVSYIDSEDIAFTLLLFYIMEDYFVSLNIVRQYSAIVVCMIGIIAFARNKHVLLGVSVLTATIVFHPSSLVVLLIPLLCRINVNKSRLVILGITVPLLAILASPIIRKIIITFTQYGRYFISNYYSSGTYSVAVELLAIYAAIYVMTIIFCSEESLIEDIRVKIFISATLLNMGIMGLSFTLTQNTYRLSYFFNPIIALYFPSVIKSMDIRKNQIIIKSATIILFSIWTFLLITHRNQNVLPYQSILSNRIYY